MPSHSNESRTIAFFQRIAREPSIVAPGLTTQRSLAEALGFDPAQFNNLIKGKLPVGAATIARATLFLPIETANELVCAYLDDEVDQIEALRAAIARKLGVKRSRHPRITVGAVVRR